MDQTSLRVSQALNANSIDVDFLHILLFSLLWIPVVDSL